VVKGVSEEPWGIIKFQKLPEIFHSPGFFHGAKLESFPTFMICPKLSSSVNFPRQTAHKFSSIVEKTFSGILQIAHFFWQHEKKLHNFPQAAQTFCMNSKAPPM